MSVHSRRAGVADEVPGHAPARSWAEPPAMPGPCEPSAGCSARLAHTTAARQPDAATRGQAPRAAAGVRICSMRAPSVGPAPAPKASAMPGGHCCSFSWTSSAAAYALRSPCPRPRSTSRSQPNSWAQHKRARSRRMKGLNQNRHCSARAAALQRRSWRRQCASSCSTISRCCKGSKPRRWRGSSRRGANTPCSIGEMGAPTSITGGSDAGACAANPAWPLRSAGSTRRAPVAASASSVRWPRRQRYSACARPSTYSASQARAASRSQAWRDAPAGAGAAAASAGVACGTDAAADCPGIRSPISMTGVTPRRSAGGNSIAANTAATASCPDSQNERCRESAGRNLRHSVATAQTAQPASSEPPAASSSRASVSSRGVIAPLPRRRASAAAVARAERAPARRPACFR